MNTKELKKGIKRSSLAQISANNALSFYTDKRNIPNQHLVNETIEYFGTGAGSRVFKPLTFLNLLWQQYNYIIENIEEPDRVFLTLNNLPLDTLQKHILFGFVIKWFGGYPLEAPLGIGNSQSHYDLRKRVLEVFLSYQGDTPEKDFCKADQQSRRKIMKLGIALTTAINQNLDATEVFNALEDDKPTVKIYNSFDELFDDAARNGSVGDFKNQQSYVLERSRYNFQFNLWLQEIKSWEYNDDEKYRNYLTKNHWIEFLAYQRQAEYEREQKDAIERQSWQIEPWQGNEMADVIKRISERTELHDFLSVPASDILYKNAFWHDEHDKPIHCNIYHPKYGRYAGFESNSRDVVVTSFNPVTIYQDPISGNNVYFSYYCQMLCTADEENFTNKD
jgi:hypothetical protein